MAHFRNGKHQLIFYMEQDNLNAALDFAKFLEEETTIVKEDDLLEWVAIFYGALKELVDLKDYKEKAGKDRIYSERQPMVWHSAKQAIELWAKSDYGAMPLNKTQSAILKEEDYVASVPSLGNSIEKFGMVRLYLLNELIDLRPKERELREKMNAAKNEKQRDFFLKALTNVQGWIKEFADAYDLLGTPNMLNSEQNVQECDAREAKHTDEPLVNNISDTEIEKKAEEVEKLAEDYSQEHMFCLDGKNSAKKGFIAGYNLGKASIQQH